MADKYTADELNKLGQKELVGLVLSMQDEVSRLNTNLETLIEAVRADNQNHFGRTTERHDQIVGTKYDLNPYEKDILFLFCGTRRDRIRGLLYEGLSAGFCYPHSFRGWL